MSRAIGQPVLARANTPSRILKPIRLSKGTGFDKTGSSGSCSIIRRLCRSPTSNPVSLPLSPWPGRYHPACHSTYQKHGGIAAPNVIVAPSDSIQSP
jgi:hypothetical protein